MTRRLRPLLALVALLPAACADDAGTTSSTTTTSIAVADAAATPAGEQLAWVLGSAATASDEELAERFAPSFLAQVPAAQVREVAAGLGAATVAEVQQSSGTRQVALVAAGDGTALLTTIEVEPEPPHRILTLFFAPAELPPSPTSWEEVEARLAELAPEVSFLAGEVGDDGTVVPALELAPTTSRPLGSIFKLYVLGAVAEAVAAGDLAWDQEVTVTEADRSLPSGQLQDRVGDTLTVAEVATLMISISDNTATDLLLRLVGRDAVEAQLAPMGLGDASRALTLPFLSTRELFVLKLGDPDRLAAYAADDEAGRRAILDALEPGVPDLAEIDFDTPTAIDTVEWFASPEELVAAHVALDDLRRRPGLEPVGEALSANPGVDVDPATFPHAAFKGGSEPGVLALSWLLERQDGRRFVVVLLASDTAAPVDELEGAAIGQGAIDLLAG